MKTATRSLAATLLFVLTGTAVAVWLAGSSYRSEGRDEKTPVVAVRSNTVVQAFPAKGFDSKAMPKPLDLFAPENYKGRDTVWVVDWDVTNATGGMSSVLRINAAHFGYLDKGGMRRWITVVQDLELGEIFVPYDAGSPRFEDLENFSFRILPADKNLLGPPCLADGEILNSDRLGMKNLVYKEVHDDGIRLLDIRRSPERGRRGEKMILWVNFNGENYRYIMEYSFSDDGVISARLGATAQNFYNRQPAPRLRDAHLHVGCWTFDPILGDPTDPKNGGADKNIVRLVRRVPVSSGVPNGVFAVDISPFPGELGQKEPAVAGSALWNAEQFTVLRVQSTVRKNGSGKPQPTAYDLITVRTGSCRSFPSPQYDYTNKDFWVTPADPSFNQFRQVSTYATPPPGSTAAPVDMTSIRVWHNSPLYHLPRGEDFGPDGESRAEGSALLSWAGFILKPRDLFDGTPLLPK